jgi:hypothetical protein
MGIAALYIDKRLTGLDESFDIAKKRIKESLG